MKKLHRLTLLLLLLTPFIAVSQTVIKGVVYEKTDKTPVPGAVISLMDENQELIAYDISSGKGEYTLSIDKDSFRFNLEAIAGQANTSLDVMIHFVHRTCCQWIALC